MIKKLLSVTLLLLLLAPGSIDAQCASSANGGSSSNLFTILRNSTTPIVANKDLNTIVCVHRNNHTVFGGNSGQLRYDISTNGGATWSNNQGALNASTGVLARYPNAVLHNPPGNTNPSNASLGYLASVTDLTYWDGYVSGTKPLNGSVIGETYTTPFPNSLIAGSLTKGAPGVYWGVDESSDGVSTTGSVLVYKGVWNGSSINWSTNAVLTPGINTSLNGNAYVYEVNIAFDPTGTVGWISIISHLNSGPSAHALYPIFYKTTNGGTSWSGPISVNLNQLSCITSNLYTTAAIDIEGDLTVDAYGNPHFIAIVGNLDSPYSIDYNSWHHVMDITQKNGLWTAYDLANVAAGPYQFSGSTSTVNHLISPQIARSADGRKVFFSWTDNSSYATGSPNWMPDLFGRALDVTQNLLTNVKDFTSCSQSAMGSVRYPHVAEEVLEPTTSSYMMAVVYAEMVNGNPDDVTNLKFLNNVTFSNSDFYVSIPALNLNLSPKGNISLCQGNTANLVVTGNFPQIIWSTGSNQNNITVFNPGTYIVAARSGCALGADSAIVKTLTMQAKVVGGTACSGSPVTLSVSGNAGGYTWTPGNQTGPTVTVFPSGNTIYYVQGSGHNCSSTASLAVGITPSPTLYVVNNRPESCAGEFITLQATGADEYVWNTGDSTSSIGEYLQATTSYTVKGKNIFGCSSTYSLTQIVNPCVGLDGLSSENSLNLFPNPASDVIRTTSKKNVQVTLINSLGQAVERFILSPDNDFEFNASHLPRGVYFASMECQTLRSTQKVILK